MLGDHRDVVDGQAQTTQAPRERRVGPPGRRTEDPQAGRRDRALDPVRERARVGEHRADRQAELERDVAADDEQRSPALRLDEPAPSQVARSRRLLRVDAQRVELIARRGRTHVPEADQPLGREVVEAPRQHRAGLAAEDLVVRLLQRDRRGRARGDRVDHRTVRADVGLDHVRGDDVAERLLDPVRLAGLVEQVVEQQPPQRRHPPEAAALGVGDQRRMDVTEQLLGLQARRAERLAGARQVDQRHPVGRRQQIVGNAPGGQVEPGRELAGHAAAVLGDPRDPDLRARGQRHAEAALVDDGHATAVAGQRAGGVGVVDREADVALDRDRGQHVEARGVDRAVGLQRPDAGALGDRVGVARRQLVLGDVLPGRDVDPAAAVALGLEADQAAEPGQLGDRARRQAAVALGGEAGPSAAERPQLAGPDDHHQVLGAQVVGGQPRPVRVPTRAVRCVA